MDLCDDPLHEHGPRWVPTQGYSTDHREASPEVIGWELRIPTSGDSDAGIMV